MILDVYRTEVVYYRVGADGGWDETCRYMRTDFDPWPEFVIEGFGSRTSHAGGHVPSARIVALGCEIVPDEDWDRLVLPFPRRLLKRPGSKKLMTAQLVWHAAETRSNPDVYFEGAEGRPVVAAVEARPVVAPAPPPRPRVVVAPAPPIPVAAVPTKQLGFSWEGGAL